MPRARSASGVALALSATAALACGPIATGTAAASASPVAFVCVVQSATTCLITIQLTSNMDEQITSTMPNANENWWNSDDAGSVGTGGYTLSGPGNPTTSWNGNPALLSGQVWSAHLSTGTEASGAYATLTFQVVPGRSYSSFSVSYPLEVSTGSPCTVTATVHPVPAKGHLLLQRHDGTAWANAGAFTYAAKARRWTVTFRWPYPKHTTKILRVEATAAPGLLTTPSAPFHISTYSVP